MLALHDDDHDVPGGVVEHDRVDVHVEDDTRPGAPNARVRWTHPVWDSSDGRSVAPLPGEARSGATPEPAGNGDRGAGVRRGPRFVIQEHHARRLHWDLRLEHDGVLASWAVPRGIPPGPDRNNLAVRTEDHPLEYLDFHGEIPAGQYGAGTMAIWDRGTYDEHKWRDDEVMVTFHGERVRGRYVLFRTRGTTG